MPTTKTTPSTPPSTKATTKAAGGVHRPLECGPFRVRRTTSGYNGVTKFLVVKNPGGSRVSVHAHVTVESAWAAADELNIGEMVKPHAEDDRPYKERRAEAESRYWDIVAGTSRATESRSGEVLDG